MPIRQKENGLNSSLSLSAPYRFAKLRIASGACSSAANSRKIPACGRYVEKVAPRTRTSCGSAPVPSQTKPLLRELGRCQLNSSRMSCNIFHLDNGYYTLSAFPIHLRSHIVVPSRSIRAPCVLPHVRKVKTGCLAPEPQRVQPLGSQFY